LGYSAVPTPSIASFTNSIGVQTHIGLASSPYDNLSTIQTALSFVGIKHVRDGIGSSADLIIMQELNSALGTTFDSLISFSTAYGETCPPTGWNYSNVLSSIQANPTLFEAVEGANEVDSYVPCWNSVSSIAAGIAEQEQLWSTYPPLPVYSLTLASIANLAEVGNISNYVSQVGSHVYPQYYGTEGESVYTASQVITSTNNATLAPGKPNVITEGGWWTAPYSTGVSQLIQAKLELSFLLDNYSLGVTRTYLYELFDELSDPTAANFQDHFGLFNFDGTAKTFATALNTMQTILHDTGTLTTPGSLSYTLSGMPTAGHSLLFERSDGTFILALWNDAPVWDNNNYVPITVASSTVTVTPATTPSSMNEYDPLVGTTAVTSSTSASISFSLVDHPVFVLISP